MHVPFLYLVMGAYLPTRYVGASQKNEHGGVHPCARCTPYLILEEQPAAEKILSVFSTHLLVTHFEVALA